MHDPGPTYGSVEEITCEYVLRGIVRRREVARAVIEKRGSWATLVFAFQDLIRGEYGPVRYRIARWRLSAGRWHSDTGINLRPDLELLCHAKLMSWDPRQLAADADR